MTPQRKFVLACIDNPIGRGVILAFLMLASALDRMFSLFMLIAVLRHADRSSFCHWSTQIKNPGNIRIGRQVTIGHGCVLGAKEPITIGDHVRIGRNVTIETGGLLTDQPPPYQHTAKAIRIDEGAIIYANATILGGVTIGKYAIVSAGCVVAKDVPPYCIVGVARRQEVLRRPSVRRTLEAASAGGARDL